MEPPSPGASSDPSAPSARSAAEVADPEALWRLVLERIASRPPLSWARQLRFIGADLEAGTMSLELPARKNVARFMGERQRDQIVEIVSEITGRRFRVEVSSRMMAEERGVDGGDRTASGAIARGRTRGAPEEVAGGDRRKLLSLPLVKRVAERFDVTLVNARPEPELGRGVEPPPESGGDDAAGEDSGDDER